MPSLRIPAAAFALAVLCFGGHGEAAPCGDDSSGFDAWVSDFHATAAAAGISVETVDSALDGLAYSDFTILLDRHQGSLRKDFETFAENSIPPRMARARKMLKERAAEFASLEERFGVPKEVLAAIWGLETDFGTQVGNASTLGALATLAYDCRRSEFFVGQLLDALRIIDRGDLSVEEMKGGLHGELGQTQFLPSSYVTFAIDFDGDGRADLLKSSADALASTANYLKEHGWQSGQAWDVGAPNFAVLKSWNESEVYSQTVGEFARRLAPE